jgi:hypothetical protein
LKLNKRGIKILEGKAEKQCSANFDGRTSFGPKTVQNHETPTAMRKMAMGGMGGVMAGLMTYPNDTIRRLLQLQGSRGTATEFTGYFDCMKKNVRRVWNHEILSRRGVECCANGTKYSRVIWILGIVGKMDRWVHVIKECCDNSVVLCGSILFLSELRLISCVAILHKHCGFVN